MMIHPLPQISFCAFILLTTPWRVFSIPEFDTSQVEVPEDFVFQEFNHEDENNLDAQRRHLQVEGPYHNGTRFFNMFLNGDRWQNDVAIAQSADPTKIGWKNGYMYFGDESRTQAHEEAKQTFTVAGGTFNGYSSGLRVWHEMSIEASYARANFMEPLCISTCYLATVNVYGSGTLQMYNRHMGVFTGIRDQQFKDAAASRFAEVFPRYIMRANQVQRLLDGLTGTIDESYISFRSMNARLVTRNQIRVVFDGLGYMHRVYENKYSGFTNALSFAEMHNTVNGANNPPFSKCRKSYLSYTSPDPTIPEDAETAFCCNGQCTTDISTKAWQSYGCELTVDDCYNAMRDTCAPKAIRCMQLIADPEDQWPSYREPLPHKNLWVWSAHLDMVGGGEYSNEWQRWVRNNSEDPIEFAKIEGHHTIPFTNIGFGNGNYEITFMLKQGDLINQASLPLVKLVVYSYSVNAVLYEQMVNCGDIPTGQVWTPITFELVMADRHLADLAFRIEMQPNTNTQVGYDYVKVKYLFYDTLSPTFNPTMAPTLEPSPVPGPCVPVRVDLLTDRCPQETSWTIKDPNDNVVLSGQGYSIRSHWHYTYGCLNPATTYIVTIFDTAGDGICCGYGQGFFAVMLNNGSFYTFTSNGEFGRSVSQYLYT